MVKKTMKSSKKADKNPASEKIAKAVAKYVRISPRKARLVLDVVRRKPVTQAQYVLGSLNKKAARLAERVLNSALANAIDIGMDEERLYVSDCRADGGPTLKRFQPRSQGRADRILKRTTHLSVVLKEGQRVVKREPAQEVEEAVADKPEKKAVAKKKRTVRKKKKAAAASK